MHADTLIADHMGSPRSSPVNVTIGATLSLLDTTITSTNSMQPSGPKGLDKTATGAAISAYSGSKVWVQLHHWWSPAPASVRKIGRPFSMLVI